MEVESRGYGGIVSRIYGGIVSGYVVIVYRIWRYNLWDMEVYPPGYGGRVFGIWR